MQNQSRYSKMAEDSYAHHFSRANIPFGIASSSSSHPNPAAATRLGNDVIFLDVLFDTGLFNGIPGLSPSTFKQVSLKASRHSLTYTHVT
jgi:fumarylacetoacetase